MLLAPIHRALLPCLHQHLGHSSQQQDSSCAHQQQHQQQPGLLFPQHQQWRWVHTQQQPDATHLTDQQKQELKQAVLGSFQRDPQAASKLLAKSLSDDAKRQLLSVLEAAQGPPGLSRTAMVDTHQDNNHTPPPTAASASAVAAEQQLAQEHHASTSAQEAPPEVQEPTFKQLLRMGVTKGLPFVAFGFFDNIIMITAGEQIDLMFGAKLGLSSMAAAGLGNTVADVVGINISHTIERKFKDMKSMAPALTKAQLALPRTQRAKWLGCAIGMASGCLLGLTPLLFYDTQGEGSSSSGSGKHAAAAPA